MSITPKETSINEASSGTFCHEIKSESNVNKVKKNIIFQFKLRLVTDTFNSGIFVINFHNSRNV